MSGDEHASETEEALSLAEVGNELLDQARAHGSRRAARTVAAGPSLRATVMALKRVFARFFLPYDRSR